MADEIVTRQQLVDAGLDAESLQKFISGLDSEDVLTRLGKIYPTLAKLVRILMETGGWKAYSTEAELLATIPTVNPSVGYAFDTKKLYKWNGTSWTDEGLSQLASARKNFQNLLKFTENSQNLFSLSPLAIYSKIQVESQISKDKFSISDTSIVSFAKNIVLNQSVISASASIGSIEIKNGSNKVVKSVLLPYETVVNNLKSTLWVDYTLIDLSSISVVTDVDGGFRVRVAVENPIFQLYINEINVVDESGFFQASTQENISSVNKNAISSHGNKAIQFRVLPATLIEFSYSANQNGAIEFVKDILNFVKLKVKTATVHTEEFELNNLVLPRDKYAFTFSNITGKLNYSTISTEIQLVEGNSFKLYSTSVKNSSSIKLSNSLVALKVNFAQGEVKTNNQIIVLDNSGMQYQAQFAPDISVNFKNDSSDGYYSDGSFKSGTLYLIDNLDIDEQKNYEVRVYDSAVSNIEKEVEKSLVGNRDVYAAYGYKLYFEKTQGEVLTAIELNGKYIDLVQSIRHTVANSSDPSTNQGDIFRGVKDIVLARAGHVFIDIEATVFNSNFQTLAANSLKAKFIFRLFRNGLLKIINYTKAIDEISGKILYGLHSAIKFESAATNISFNDTYAHLKASFDNNEINLKAVYFHGDIARDGLQYGPTRPTNVFKDLTPTGIDLRFGWRDTYGSASSGMWNVEKNYAWGTEIDIYLNPWSSTSDKFASFINNVPTGFLGERALWNLKKKQLLAKIEQYSFSNLEWWYSPFSQNSGGNPTSLTSTMYVYSAELMNFYVNNVGTFEAIYTKFINNVKGRFGNDLSQIGSKYTNGKFYISQESRHIAPALQWLYMHAYKTNDAAKLAELRTIAKSIAEALVSYFNSTGGIGITGNIGDLGASNIFANGLRFIALAIFMEQDLDGSMLKAFNAAELLLVDPSKYMPLLNQLNDVRNDVESRTRYLHYAVFACYGYRLACSVLNKEPKFDLAQFALNALNGSGDLRDIEYCISDSRRGGRNTLGFMLHCLTHQHLDGHMNAAHAAFDSLVRNGWNDAGLPIRMYGFSGNTSDQSMTMPDVAYNLHALADLWLSYHYGLYK
ncbi:hypothetical protein [Acinetobacter pittii]|uniref:hypothetical protein n=5 Tax=Acinetobacter pittii TaxID=48296 RepID=UPI001D17A481|nr:hypothetical protein [Acinetobacter pittii]